MTIAKLKRVLEAAATTPGNCDRFQQAGLINTSRRNDAVQLAPDWQNAFLKLRPIDKQTVRSQPGLFLANVDDVVYRGTTSGSRGESFVYFAPTQWNEARQTARRRSLLWWGIDDSTRIINVASRLLPVREIDAAIAGQTDRDFIDLLLALLKERPVAIRGYPSRLCEVAARLSQNVPAAIAVICTGECLFEYQRTLLQKVFNCRIIEEYGCQETGISGMTCPEAGRLHLDSDRCLYEVIDGQLVTTDLLNFVMPMVRYKCGDIVDLNSEPCPCGRSGFTAKIRGRIEDQIRTLDGIKHPGDIAMPAMDRILNYHVVRREATEIDFWLQLEDAEVSLSPLVKWSNATFGEVSAQVFVDDLSEIRQSDRTLEDGSWIRTITSGSWAEWLNEGLLPKGSARKTAQLLKQLIDPAVVLGAGLPPTTKALLDWVIALPPSKDPDLERITARVLLFSCNFLADDPQVVGFIYNRAKRSLEDSLDDAAQIDLLVPSLFLDTATAKAIWATTMPTRCKLDTFNIHNLLYAFEPAAKIARKRQSNVISALRPILAVLIGDLNFFAGRFGVWLLAHWCELIHGEVIAPPHTAEAPNDDFLKAWLTWRRQLIGGQLVSPLQQAARSPHEQARVYLEQAYGLLVAGQQLDPHQWLDIMDKNADAIGDDLDPVPWIPILQKLSKPLLASGERDLAYQCLVASATPESRPSAFERLAFQVNDKQSVLIDQTIQT